MRVALFDMLVRQKSYGSAIKELTNLLAEELRDIRALVDRERANAVKARLARLEQLVSTINGRIRT